MAVSLREYRARIKSVESTKKITRAMELIAASRIIKAQQRAQAAAPYARELTRAVSAVATYSNVDHPLTVEEEDPKRAAVLVITSDRGQRLMALLKQPQYSPYPLEEMTISLWLGTSGKLDQVPTDDVLRFENEFLDYLRRSHAELLDGIRESLKFEDDAAAAAEKAYDSFLDQFETSDGQSIKVGREAPAEALGDDELQQETIVKQKRG